MAVFRPLDLRCRCDGINMLLASPGHPIHQMMTSTRGNPRAMHAASRSRPPPLISTRNRPIPFVVFFFFFLLRPFAMITRKGSTEK